MRRKKVSLGANTGVHIMNVEVVAHSGTIADRMMNMTARIGLKNKLKSSLGVNDRVLSMIVKVVAQGMKMTSAGKILNSLKEAAAILRQMTSIVMILWTQGLCPVNTPHLFE